VHCARAVYYATVRPHAAQRGPEVYNHILRSAVYSSEIKLTVRLGLLIIIDKTGPFINSCVSHRFKSAKIILWARTCGSTRNDRRCNLFTWRTLLSLSTGCDDFILYM